jgi:hypothetical protein
MSAGDTGARSADIKGLREFNELNARGVDAAKKDGYLEADAWRAATLNRVQALAFPVDLDFQTSPVVRAN